MNSIEEVESLSQRVLSQATNVEPILSQDGISDSKGAKQIEKEILPKTALDFVDRDQEDSDGLMKVPKGKKGLLSGENVDSEQMPSSATNVKMKVSR